MQKAVVLITGILLLTTTATAYNITPSHWDVTGDPGEYRSNTFSVNLTPNETVDLASDKDWVTFSKTHFEQDGNSTITIVGKDTPGNYTANITANNNPAITIDYTVTDPYTTLFDGWMNASEKIVINGQDYKVLEIKQNLHLVTDKNSTITIQNEKTVGPVQLILKDTIPGAYAHIEARTQEDVDFAVEHDVIPPSERPCELGIRTITTLSRGATFSIETINENTEDTIGNIKVTLLDNGRTENQLIAGPGRSDNGGYFAAAIPEDTRGPVIARLQDTDHNDKECKDSNQRVNFRVPYNQHLENSDALHLKLTVNNTTVFNESIYGTITNREGNKVTTGVMEISGPDGSKTELSFDHSTFSYTPQTNGEYTIKATKSGYKESNTLTVTVLGDTDNDGVPNPQDKCPDDAGTKENNGCTPQETRIQIFGQNGEQADSLNAGNSYTIRLTTSNGTVEEDTDITVETDDGNTTDLSLDDGETTWTPETPTGYSIKYGGNNLYARTTERIDVEQEPYNLAKIAAIAFGIIGIGGAVVLWRKRDGNSGRSGGDQIVVTPNG